MATIFDFNGSWRLYHGGGRWSKIRRGVGLASEELRPKSLLFFKTLFAHERSSWLVRLSSSCQSHSKCVIWTSFWHFALSGQRERWLALIERLLVSNSLSSKHGRSLKSEQKEAISQLVFGTDLLVVLPTGFWKSLIFQVLVLMKEIVTGKLWV